MDTVKNKNIWVIGASSGIGQALVELLDQQGANLAISARSEEALYNVSKACTSTPMIYPLDVTDSQSLKAHFQGLTTAWDHIDSVVYLPAAYHPTKLERLDLQTARTEIDINLMAVFNFIDCIQQYFKQQKYGQILICSSVAGFCGLPNAQPYSATKAAVTNLTETFKCEYAYLDIKVIHPGFVKTRLTDKNQFKMPMIITAEQAAGYIYKGMLSSKFEIAFPKRFAWLIKLMRLLPYKVYFKLWASKR